MKETFYFSHDYNARTDTKIKKLLARHGMEGYGAFWAIVEDLYNNANALQSDCESIAYDLRVSENIIKSILTDFELFTFSEDKISSKSIMDRINKRNEKSEKASLSAKARWSNANALQSHTDRNANKGKERKGKESKITDTGIVASTKNENEIFFENIQTDTDTVLNNMNIPEEHRDQGRQELFKFWNYWTEKDLRGKERWRKEKTFEVKRRLTTWLMNTKQFTNKNYEKPKFTR